MKKNKQLSPSYMETYQKLERHLVNQKMDPIKIQILLRHIMIQFQDGDRQQRDMTTIVGKNFQQYLSKVEKGIDFKEELKKQKTADYEKYVICGLWFTMCSYIVLLFIKEVLSQHFLIAFSVDVLVAIVAFYVGLHNVFVQRTVLKNHQIKQTAIQLQLASLLCGVFIIWISVGSPFDVSFLLLVISYLMGKRMVKKAFTSQL